MQYDEKVESIERKLAAIDQRRKPPIAPTPDVLLAKRLKENGQLNRIKQVFKKRAVRD